MKLKHYSLWALALAFAVVSCSDDLENSGKNETDDGNGKKAYMTINISTVSDGVMTKAGLPNENDKGGAGWGEDGNGWLDELENKNEAKIHSINIFLVETDELVLNAGNHLTLFNISDNTKLNAPFAGYAYETCTPPLDARPDIGGEENHGSRNVKVTMTKDLDSEAKKYQVFTIVNTKDLTKEITTLKALRDYVHKPIIEINSDNMEEADKFVMSTHKMFGTSGLSSTVSLSSANTAENPASTAVYVERLAARIDLKYPTDQILPNNNDDSPVHEKGEFKLTGYMVVNQWMGGTKMFKQVSPTQSSPTDDLDSEPNLSYGSQWKYLGDEIWNKTQNRYNFVLSEHFYDKTHTKISDDGKWTPEKTDENDPVYYKNHFWGTNLNNKNNVKSIPDDIPNLGGYKENNDDPLLFHPIAYVRENTMNTQEQRNGFSTGVIFRTKFTPNADFKMMEYIKEANGDKPAGSIIETKLADGVTEFEFLTAEHYDGNTGQVGKLVYKDIKTVAARAFNIPTGEDTQNLLKGFMDGWNTVTTTATLEDIKKTVEKMSEKNGLSKLFKQYLNSKLATAIDFGTVKGDLCYDKFVENEPDNYENLIKKEFKLYDPNDIALLAEHYGIYFFRNGQSYHKFWIRHDDNNNNNEMGVMEFAIVRNNVYLLNVTGVRGLGDPLPYTPGKDDPETPDESNEVTIDVTIYVKDWVKRRNDNIIL